jgi:hypothetical protein
MKQTLTTSDIARQLHEDENAGWSYAGALALAEHLEEMEGSFGSELEFDRVAIRCDWAEYKGLREWAEDYFGGITKWEAALCIEPDTTPDECDERIMDYINDRGMVIEFDGGIIVPSF